MPAEIQITKSVEHETIKVLITAPSLDENENVSGVSTMIKGIIKYGNGNFVHFTAGRKDGIRHP